MQRNNLPIFAFDGKLAVQLDKDSFYVLDNAFVTTCNISTKNDFADFTSFGDEYTTKVVTNSWGEVEISLRCDKIEIRSGNIADLVPVSLTKEIQSATKKIEDFSQLQRYIDF